MSGTYVIAGLGVLTVVAGIVLRARLRARIERSRIRLDDDAIRRIESTGTLPAPEVDEPLEPEEIRRAEEEFWEEYWDEPDPF